MILVHLSLSLSLSLSIKISVHIKPFSSSSFVVVFFFSFLPSINQSVSVSPFMGMMDAKGRNIIRKSGSTAQSEEEMMGDLRRGPWTVEEDFKLINYIANNGEGRWNSLARCAGLRRTGKSCRLRWLNYLRPDVRRGNITLEEQLMILELHSRWGNRWSKIAQYLPGRTDNEIKNYWRTRVQKHAKQLKCDVNSKQFKDTMKYLWMPRLVERIQAAAGSISDTAAPITTVDTASNQQLTIGKAAADVNGSGHMMHMAPAGASIGNDHHHHHHFGVTHVTPTTTTTYTPENSSTAASSDSLGAQVSPVSDLTTDYYNIPAANQNTNPDYFHSAASIVSPSGYFGQGLDFHSMEQNNQYWLDGAEATDNLWNAEDIWFLQQQLSSSNM